MIQKFYNDALNGKQDNKRLYPQNSKESAWNCPQGFAAGS